MKKQVYLIIFFLVVFCLPSSTTLTARANNNEYSESVENLIENFDYGELESYFESSEDLNIFRNRTLIDVIKDVVYGGSVFSLLDVFGVIFNSAGDTIASVLKMVSLIVAIVGFGAFSNMLQSVKDSDNGLSGIINFFLLTLVLSVVSAVIVDFVSETTQLLYKIKDVMELVFPLLLSLLITVGGSTSSAVYQPAVIVLTSGVIEVVVFATSSVVSLLLCLSVVGELTDNIKLDKLKSFLVSTYKWVLGLIFTVFLGYLSLSGITAGGTDKISIKTAKYAIKSYIPLVGGYVSDSYEIFRMGSVLLKNSIGIVGVVLLFSLIIGKVITLILYNLGFKLASGLSEPMGMGKVSRFLSSLSTIFNFLIAGLVSCFLLCFFTILIIMSSANVV